MAKYRLSKTADSVIRTADNANIPATVTSKDWRQYLEWLSAGNNPDPVTPEPPPTQEQLDVADAKTDADVIELANMVKADISALLAGIVDPQAKQVLRKLLKVVRLLARRI